MSTVPVGAQAGTGGRSPWPTSTETGSNRSSPGRYDSNSKPMGWPVVASFIKITPSPNSVQIWFGRGACQNTVSSSIAGS